MPALYPGFAKAGDHVISGIAAPSFHDRCKKRCEFFRGDRSFGRIIAKTQQGQRPAMKILFPFREAVPNRREINQIGKAARKLRNQIDFSGFAKPIDQFMSQGRES